MKFLIFVSMIFGMACSASALDLGDTGVDTAKITEQVKAKAQDVMAACKEDKVKYCDKYTELKALQDCLKKNKANLSEGCAKSLHVK